MAERKTGELRVHRWSAPGLRYFITVCTHDRRPGIMAPGIRDLILQSVSESDSRRDTETSAFTVMPDHIHWFFRLGSRLSLGSVVGRFKAETRVGLAKAGLRWQRDYFERRLRAEERAEDYGRYIFLNPYRAELLKRTELWPAWWCPMPGRFEFLTCMNPDGSVPWEWIGAQERSGLSVTQTGRD